LNDRHRTPPAPDCPIRCPGSPDEKRRNPQGSPLGRNPIAHTVRGSAPGPLGIIAGRLCSFASALSVLWTISVHARHFSLPLVGRQSFERLRCVRIFFGERGLQRGKTVRRTRFPPAVRRACLLVRRTARAGPIGCALATFRSRWPARKQPRCSATSRPAKSSFPRPAGTLGGAVSGKRADQLMLSRLEYFLVVTGRASLHLSVGAVGPLRSTAK
jgi:hypothetical protein